MVEKRMLQELVSRNLVLGVTGLSSQQGSSAGHRSVSASDDGVDEYDPQSGYGPDDPSAYYGIGPDTEFYQDESTGSMYQAPPTAARNNRLGNVKQQGEMISRQLLLNYIAQYPSIYPTVKQYVSAEDYGETDSLTGRVAQLIYDQMEKNGKVDEASILSRFPDAADQTRIAGMFHTLDPASSRTEREKAIRETLLKVFSAASGSAGGDLQTVIRRKNQEAQLRTLRITLD